jgi:hypothetical protein
VSLEVVPKGGAHPERHGDAVVCTEIECLGFASLVKQAG